MLGFTGPFIDNRLMSLSVPLVLRVCVLSACCVFFAACERSGGKGATGAPQAAAVAPVALETGARLYAEHCAECHGPQGQGHPDWQNAASGGFVAAPPLDTSGPLPQRSHAALIDTVKAGVQRNGVPVMPAWQGRLADADIDAIFAWIFSQWPPAQYAAWRTANARPATASTHPQ